jgi:hypothetical protein
MRELTISWTYREGYSHDGVDRILDIQYMENYSNEGAHHLLDILV